MSPIERLEDDKLIILLFHGVVKDSPYEVRNYMRKHLKDDVFYNLLKSLKDRGTSVSMDEVVECCKNQKTFPQKAFAVTFDDGFENNYSVAAPILRELAIPATFYITTNFVENNQMSWIDRVEYCMEGSESGVLKLPWVDKEQSFLNAKDKITVLNDIRKHVKTDASINVDQFVSNIFEQCHKSAVTQSREPIDLKMSWQQVKELAEDPLFTIGGHTHTHSIMSFLDSDSLNTEISTSLELLKQKANVQTMHYSYPEGLEHCFSNEVISALKTKGIECCPTAIDGVNTLDQDLFHLRRISVT